MRLPYPGLRPFRREESDLFFGREGCVDEMVNRLAATRFLAVLGASGSGKSSLVNTGLLDALELGLYAQAGSTWTIVQMRPGGDPIRNLAQALASESAAKRGENNVSPAEVDLLARFLRRGPRSVAEWYRNGNFTAGSNLLILVDQFEELFRYGDYAGREEAEAFVALLLESCRSPEFPIHLVITMRSEFLGACALVPGLAERINAGLFLTPRMSRDQIGEAIEGPAGVCGFRIEPALVNRLLNDLASFAPWEDDRSGDQLQRLARRADQLPLMQHVLNRLWLRSTENGARTNVELMLADYETLGGLRGALDAHAAEVFNSLQESDKPIVEKVFRALVTGPSIPSAVRRPSRFAELVEIAGGDGAAVARIVDAFRTPDCNFLTPPSSVPLAGDTIVDISHEALIRQWSMLSGWLQKEAQAASDWRRLTMAAEAYRKGQGELLGGLDLANFSTWWESEKPSAAWAGRYGGNYGDVVEVLQKSKARSQAARWRRISIIAGSVAGVILAGLVMLQQQNSNLATNRLLLAERESQLAKSQRELVNAQRQNRAEQNAKTNLQDTKDRIGVLCDHRQLTADECTFLLGKIQSATQNMDTAVSYNATPTSEQKKSLSNGIPLSQKLPNKDKGVSNAPAATQAPQTASSADASGGAAQTKMVGGIMSDLASRMFEPSAAVSTDVSGVAIRGFDPVAYFTQGTPTPGRPQFYDIWSGAIWLFADAKDRALFHADPARYAPAYGGFCTYCMGIGDKAHADPSAWIIYKGRLYLHISLAAREEWMKKSDTNIAQANRNWQTLGPRYVFPDTETDLSQQISAAIMKYPNLVIARLDYAVQVLRQGVKDSPDEKEYADRLLLALRTLSFQYSARKDSARAIALMREAADRAQSRYEATKTKDDKKAYETTLADLAGLDEDANDMNSAIVAKREQIALLRTDPAAKPDLVEALGNLSWYSLSTRQWALAKSTAEDALNHRPLKASDATSWIAMNDAHARMFLGDNAGARAIYLRYRNQKNVLDQGTWKEVVLADFAKFRADGIKPPPLMDEIQALFSGSH
jgi:hypothetical protein